MAAEKIAGEMAQGNPRLPGACFQCLDDIGLDGYFVMTVSQFRYHPDEGQRGSAGPAVRPCGSFSSAGSWRAAKTVARWKSRKARVRALRYTISVHHPEFTKDVSYQLLVVT